MSRKWTTPNSRERQEKEEKYFIENTKTRGNVLTLFSKFVIKYVHKGRDFG